MGGNASAKPVPPSTRPSDESCKPAPGQNVVIAGTGKWWAGHELRAVVVDVREFDDSVKVQYADGTFKRLKTGEYKELVKRIHITGYEDWAPSIGDHIYVSGTGLRWSGKHFGAVIVDVRKPDDTVKLRYIDGGYKRMSTGVLRALVTDKPPPPSMPEEWADLHTRWRSDEASEIRKLHDEIAMAQRQGYLLLQADLEDQFQAKMEERDKSELLNKQLLDAVNRGDYSEAHKLQQAVNRAEGKPVQTLSTPKVVQPETTWRSLDGSSEQSDPSAFSGLDDALKRGLRGALGGGAAGASAMVLQVMTFYWLRTTMNYQYRFGVGSFDAIRTLYAQGGVGRFYRGVGPALVQGPLLRFGDTATNAGFFAFFEGTEAEHWPTFVKTAFASAAAASLRILLVPVDTVKTIMQVEGKKGLSKLAAKQKVGGTSVLFHGAVASSLATFVGHYPWFTIFNTLNEKLPKYSERHKQLLRHAGIGFCASVASDTVANGLRVVKTIRQTNETLSYEKIVRKVVNEDGLASLLGRGLKTRLVANSVQGLMFSVLYRIFEEKFSQK